MSEVNKPAEADILALLNTWVHTPGYSARRIAEEAGIEGEDPKAAIHDALRRGHRIHVKLVNWLLRKSAANAPAGDRLQAVLATTNLSEKRRNDLYQVFLQLNAAEEMQQTESLQALRHLNSLYPLASTFLVLWDALMQETFLHVRKQPKKDVIPPGTVIRAPEKGVKLYEPPPGETEAEEPVASKAQEDKPEYSTQDAADWFRGLNVGKSKRSNLDVQSIRTPESIDLPRLDERAAADHNHGSTFIPSAPLVHETEASDLRFDRKEHYILRVTGQSMWPFIMEGDEIVVKRIDLYMPPWDSEAPAANEAQWKKYDEKVVVAVLDDGLDAVVKRLSITKRKGSKATGFKVWLKSDNPKSKAIEIDKDNSIRLVGQVVRIMRSPDNI